VAAEGSFGDQVSHAVPYCVCHEIDYHLSISSNDWDPQQPHAAVSLVELWFPILPRFMKDNVIDQLILPKLHKKVRDWSPRHQKPSSTQSLAAVIFPWLPILGSRADELLDEAKIRLGEVMKKWNIKDPIPEEFGLWREVSHWETPYVTQRHPLTHFVVQMISRGKWDTLILLNILPKLAASLESDFEVNPRSQDLVPLNRALAWSGLIRESTFAQLLEERFFPKWLDTLHFWLIQPNYNASEVASWYHYWKDLLSKYRSIKLRNLDDIEGIEHGLRYGLRLMNDAMALGEDAPQRLVKPVFMPLPVKSSANGKDKQSKSVPRSKPSTTEQQDITFRAIAEQHAADHNLIFVPTGASHLGTGKPLFRVSKSVDGRGGLTVYVGEDAVYAMMQDGTFRAVLLDDMVKMAGA
jgi:tuftelin-interacting protein 11